MAADPDAPSSEDPTLTAAFRAMGTDVTVLAPATTTSGRFDQLTTAIRIVFEDLEQIFSRFRDDSELCAVNARAGSWVDVTRVFASVLRFAIRGAQATSGLFDPTVLRPLEAVGYDRDFDSISLRRTAPPRVPGVAAGLWRGIVIRNRRVRLPSEAALDFGGVAKGWAVDRAVEAASDLRWAVVNAGGDLRVVGTPPPGEVSVAIEDPSDRRRSCAGLVLTGGAVATSSATRRSWGPGLHHLIDPRTSLPAATGIVQATAWAPTCAEAEIRSTWALLAGEAILDRFPVVLVTEGGRVVRNIDEQVAEVPS
jgi:FAD:protein FMN transferase